MKLATVHYEITVTQNPHYTHACLAQKRVTRNYVGTTLDGQMLLYGGQRQLGEDFLCEHTDILVDDFAGFPCGWSVEPLWQGHEYWYNVYSDIGEYAGKFAYTNGQFTWYDGSRWRVARDANEVILSIRFYYQGTGHVWAWKEG